MSIRLSCRLKGLLQDKRVAGEWRILISPHNAFGDALFRHHDSFPPMNERRETSRCSVCGRERLVSAALGVCRQCILDNYSAVEPAVFKAHERARSKFKIPVRPPSEGAQCALCVNMCKVADGEAGYCGIRQGRDGAVVQSTRGAVLRWYYDKLPTNCVAEFACPSGTGCGNPADSRRGRSDYGQKNLAVFYGACNFSCLFCQNWHFRRLTKARSPVLLAKQLASKADRKTACVCYFGGDPAPQIEHAIETSRILREEKDGVRICFETNGSMNRRYMREMADLSYASGGCIKIDLKTWNTRLNRALCGTDNRWTLNNFRWLADYSARREDRGVPLVVASTLMIPGYIEEEEVTELAGFIASLDCGIPYSLLAFSPAFQMMDLPGTSEAEAEACLKAAKAAGLKRVRLGNAHLVS